jgi:hypothetical protein
MSLACGGRGPCCHIGYPHRHCEHCDVVIPTYHAHYWPWSYYQTQPGVYGLSNMGMQMQSALTAGSVQNAETHTHIQEVN